MQYGLDLARISLSQYRELLKQQNLLPGRRMLHDGIDEKFERMAKYGVRTVAELKKRLSSPEKRTAFADGTGIADEYMILLKREIGSMEQKPVPLSGFPGVDNKLITELNGRGIKTSKDYFEKGGAQDGELSALCELVRINGVGGIAARMFYEAGCRSVTDVAKADAPILLAAVTRVNETKHYYGAKLGEKDMQFCIDFANLLVRYGG